MASVPFTNLIDSKYGLQGCDMIEFILKCWCAWKKEENDNNNTNNKWAEPKPSLCSLHIIRFNPHNCPGRELLVPLNRHENQGCRVLSKLAQSGTSLVAQWLRICLPIQGTWVRALVWEDPACRGATGPVSHNYWACASGASALQQERPRWWEARAPRWRVAPACRNWREPSHRNEDPTQAKINK